ncbi:hypothetical protein QTP70_027527 [Hemibagrus guttatus]|uniref:SH3 domain-containing protein n=1 Tax=Hemibagrus guttatus TaxID=175788 RepID=A0AAE0QEQ0_9TELE|nr:hypothetical protein QTP70_027527 [Hemibagrus guttatus]
MRRPPKPPRPSLPLTPKPAEPVLAHTHSLIELDEPDPLCSTHTPTHPPSGEQCGVQTDFTPALEPLTPIFPDSSHITHNSQSQALGKQEVTARPRPRPRSKALVQSVIKEEDQDQPITREVKVQTLVRLKDNGTESVFAGFTDTSLDTTSNKYLQDLLDVFGCDKPDIQTEQHDDHSDKNNEEERVTLESCLVSAITTESLETITRPEPRPRTQILKQRISTKPSDATTMSVEETITSSEEQKKPVVPPVPAPRPLVKKSSVSQEQGSSEEKSEHCPLRLPPRPPLAARMSGASIQEVGAQPAEVPFNPGKPVAITSSSRGRGKCPAKPTSHRRPLPPECTPAHTLARDAVSSVSVSKSSPSLPHQASEGKLLPLRPPPIKLSKSAGSSLNAASTNQHSGSRGAKRGPPLPPRPTPGHPLYRDYTSKTPQENTKVNPPIREPEESHPQKEKLLVVLDETGEPTETQGFPGSMKGQHRGSLSEEAIPQKSLELKMEKQTEEQQPETNTSARYRALFAFNGEDGELTFHDGDVITLIAYVNEEWGRGSLNGRTGTFPLNFVQLVQESPAKKSTPESHAPVACVGEGQTGRVLYDFTPESEDELCLKVGDVVSSLEEVDEEWFVGEIAGQRGIVPKNYIQVL